MFKGEDGCELCQSLIGFYCQKPSRPHPNCDCSIEPVDQVLYEKRLDGGGDGEVDDDFEFTTLNCELLSETQAGVEEYELSEVLDQATGPADGVILSGTASVHGDLEELDFLDCPEEPDLEADYSDQAFSVTSEDLDLYEGEQVELTALAIRHVYEIAVRVTYIFTNRQGETEEATEDVVCRGYAPAGVEPVVSWGWAD
ncbi:MAG: hypothetical protein L0332_12465 [Chloroflexi bacterium]|nr:hypothetical protein [Chloroflexota bacterium]MCI0574897.1 hypothetical protein [Chloroflexota bacterium]MCI0648399.1 hypothetical protein [Chloroflexota bacterium]MCI0727520.1 hypothetical protein [Chloroflexota bacterium]